MTFPNRKTALIIFSCISVLAIALPFCIFGISHSEEEKQIHSEFLASHKVLPVSLPEEIAFAGEIAPLRMLEVKESLEREILVNTYWQSSTLLMLKRANRWFPVIEPLLISQGVPADFKYLALIESGFTYQVSPAGASGFWQFLDGTGRSYGLEVSDQVDERYHVEKSTLAACRYLKEAKKKFGSWTLAAASYNMGMGGLQETINNQRIADYYNLALNLETGRYVYRMLALKLIHSNPENYGFKLRQKDLYQSIPSEKINLTAGKYDLVKIAFENGISFKTLKLVNPWLKKTLLNVAPGKSYALQIPDKNFCKENAMLINQEQELPSPSDSITPSDSTASPR